MSKVLYWAPPRPGVEAVRKCPMGWKVSPVMGTPAPPMARRTASHTSSCSSRPSWP